VVGIRASFLLLLAVGLAPMTAPEARASDSRLWAPHGTLVFEGGSDIIGGGDVFLPLWQRSDRLVFADLRGNINEDVNYQGNFGLAYRQLLPNDWIAGGYGFFDVARTEFENTFFEGSAGVELLSRDWEVRANGYLPGGGNERVRRGFTQLPAGGGSRLVWQEIDERALAGVDLEGGWRVPVFAPDGESDLRVFVGGFYYHGPSGYDDLAGPQVRVELRLFDLPYLPAGSRFEVGGEYRWDDERGSWGAGSLRLRIPIHFGGYGEQKLEPMQRRMVDRIVRNGVTTTRRVENERLLGPTGIPIADLAYTDGNTEGDARTVPTAGEVETAIDVAGVGGIIVALDQTGPIDPLNDDEPIALLPGQIMMGGGSSIVLTSSSGPHVFTAPGGRGLFQATDPLEALFRLADDNQLLSVDLDGGYNGVQALGDRVSVYDVNISGNIATGAIFADANGVRWLGDDGVFRASTIGDVIDTSVFGAAAVEWHGDRGLMEDISIGDVSSDAGFVPSMITWEGDDGVIRNVTGGDVTSQGSEVRAIWILGERISLDNVTIGNVTSVNDDASGLHWTSATGGSVTNLTIGDVTGSGFLYGAYGAFWSGGTGVLGGFTVGDVTSDALGATALLRTGGTGGTISGFRAGNVTAATLGGAGDAAGMRFGTVTNMDVSDVVIGNVITQNFGDGLGIAAASGSNMTFDDVTIGNVAGRIANREAAGLRLFDMENVSVTNLAIGDVTFFDGGHPFFGAAGINLSGGRDIQVSDFSVGNVTDASVNGIARGILYSTSGNSFARDGVVGSVLALNTGGRAYGVDFIVSEDSPVEDIVFGTVGANAEHAAIRFLESNGGTANDLSFATIGPNGIGVLFDGTAVTNASGTGNFQTFIQLGFQVCVDNSGSSAANGVQFDGIICP
jgi:hypothetical protein